MNHSEANLEPFLSLIIDNHAHAWTVHHHARVAQARGLDRRRLFRGASPHGGYRQLIKRAEVKSDGRQSGLIIEKPCMDPRPVNRAGMHLNLVPLYTAISLF